MTAKTNDDHTTELAAVAGEHRRRRYAPLAAGWDADRTPFPHEERRYLGSLGLLGICLPERFGGGGAPLMDALIVIEELAKECRPAAFQVFEANTGPARVLRLLGSEEQQAALPAGRDRRPRRPSRSRSPSPTPARPRPTSRTRAKCADGSYTGQRREALDLQRRARPTPTWSTPG